MSNAWLVDVKDVGLIYKTALDTDPEDVKDVMYLLGIIEGTLGEFFTKTPKKEEKNDEL